MRHSAHAASRENAAHEALFSRPATEHCERRRNVCVSAYMRLSLSRFRASDTFHGKHLKQRPGHGLHFSARNAEHHETERTALTAHRISFQRERTTHTRGTCNAMCVLVSFVVKRPDSRAIADSTAREIVTFAYAKPPISDHVHNRRAATHAQRGRLFSQSNVNVHDARSS